MRLGAAVTRLVFLGGKAQEAYCDIGLLANVYVEYGGAGKHPDMVKFWNAASVSPAKQTTLTCRVPVPHYFQQAQACFSFC